MTVRTNLKMTAAGLSLAAFSLFNVAGCGGKPEGTDNAAVVTTAPGENAAKPAAGAGSGAAPTAAATNDAVSKPAPADAGKADTAAVKAEGWGTLKGQVTFAGEPPAVKNLVEKGADVPNPQVCAAQAIPSQKFLVDKASKGVRYAIVYIPKPTKVNPDALASVSKAKVVFDQKNCTFEPHVLGVLKGQTVEILSTDQVTHNVNSKLTNTKFNNSLAPGSPPSPLTVGAAERPGAIVCDIHPWMKAWWLVTESPYFAVTDEKGNYEIKNVPAGTQKVVVWQEAAPSGITPGAGEAVVVKADGVTTKDFAIPAEKVNVANN